MHQMEQAFDDACVIYNTAECKAEDALHTFAQQSCRTLCDKLHLTLPREVRDMIYRYLLPHWPVESKYGKGVSTSHMHKSVGKLAHLMEDDYVGLKCIIEIQEEYLRTTKFYFNDHDTVQNFRMADPLDLGLLAGDFCLDVEYTCPCEGYDFGGLKRRRSVSGWGAGGWGNGGEDWGSDWDRNRTSELPLTLQSLLGFKQGTRITVEFTVDVGQLDPWPHWNAHEWLWEQVVPCAFPILRKLSLSGRKVTVRIGWEHFRLEALSNSYSLSDWMNDINLVSGDQI